MAALVCAGIEEWARGNPHAGTSRRPPWAYSPSVKNFVPLKNRLGRVKMEITSAPFGA